MNRPDEPTKYIVWITLDDVTIANGALKFIPNTHTLGFMPFHTVKGETHHTRLNLDGINVENYLYGEMKVGDVLIFHYLVIHSSDRVAVEEPRRAYRFAVQGFDKIFTPRGVPVVLKGGKPKNIEKKYSKSYKAKPKKSKSIVQRAFHKLGKMLIRI